MFVACALLIAIIVLIGSSPAFSASVLGTTSLRETWDRELRWSRCNWISHPLGYLGYAFTFSVPLALTFFFVAHRGALGLAAVGGSLAIRGSSAAVIALRTRDRAALRGLALLPVRDLLSAAVWGAALLSRRVVWRGRVFRIDHHGHLHPTPRRSRPAHRRHPGSAPVPHG